jgi:hypothetical protein
MMIKRLRSPPKLPYIDLGHLEAHTASLPDRYSNERALVIDGINLFQSRCLCEDLLHQDEFQ